MGGKNQRLRFDAGKGKRNLIRSILGQKGKYKLSAPSTNPKKKEEKKKFYTPLPFKVEIQGRTKTGRTLAKKLRKKNRRAEGR